MIVGVPKEVKDNEYRVAVPPAGVTDLVGAGHTVLVETRAGAGSGFGDDEYVKAGAKIVPTHADAWNEAEMVIKVKEPIHEEYSLLRENLLLFTYLHLAADEPLTRALADKKVASVAYETVELPDGRLPLLTPMSEVAGRMAVQVGAYHLEKMNGGRGMLLGGVPGVLPAEVVVLGGGVVGTNAAYMALGMGANVTILTRDLSRLRYLWENLHGRLHTLASNKSTIAESVAKADLLIGGVLIHGAKAPHLVTDEMVATMKPGSVIVDVAIDQGGCIETCRPTSHSNPTYVKHGVVHYCVTNMPGAVPRTSTFALSNATLPYALQLANLGFRDAVKRSQPLALGVNTYAGKITCKGVADAFGMEYTPLNELL